MRKSLIIPAIAIIAAAGVAVGAATAAAGKGPDGSPPGGRGDRWEQLDVNGDGAVTLDEMTARQREMFAAADTNGDGAVTKEEMKAHFEARHAEMRAERMGDANGDGVISKAEFDAQASERFEKLDTNGDGVLSDDELKAGGHRGHGGKHKRR